MNIRLSNRACAGLVGGVLALALTLPAAAEPALWRVRGPHATVYLFGTMHLLKKTTEWRSPKIEAAFMSADSLLEEIKNPDDLAMAQPLLAKFGTDAAHPLSSKMDDAGRAKLTAVIASLGLPIAQIEPLRPWFAALNLASVQIVKAGYDPRSGADIVLKTLATEGGKPVEGFETIEQQIHFFADMSPQREADYLLSVLDDIEKGTALLDRGVDAWAAGDTQTLEALLNSHIRDRYPDLYQTLLVQRNRAFAYKVEQLLKGKGAVFVAIGESHLVGVDSVISDLARDGIAAERQ